MWTISEVKEKGKIDKSVNYWKGVLVSLIFLFAAGSGSSGGHSGDGNSSEAVSNAFSSSDVATLVPILLAVLGTIAVILLVSLALKIFVFNPLSTGCYQFFLFGTSGQESDLACLGYAFKNNYKNQVLVIFMQKLFITLWTLLFIVPGIIKTYQYRMVPYILAENPDIDFRDALSQSKEMMNGEKWDAFLLDLSFIGWGVLSLLTVGILYIFHVGPYVNFTNAELYVSLKEKYAGAEEIF